MKKILLAVLAIALTGIPLSTTASVAAYAQDKQDNHDKQDQHDQQDKRINGKWLFVLNTQGGDREFNAEFTVDADGKVTGTWDKKPATGTYKDGHLQLAFDVYSEEANETSQLQVNGMLDDSATITGNWVFSSYDGTFKATHPKP